MQLRLERQQYLSGSTIGRLYVDDAFECYTLEDGIRTHKVYGETAIPAGAYRVVVDYSNHFRKDLPHVLDVPGFEGIRIHPGNAPKDTLGCVLVGRTWRKGAETIADSRAAFTPLFERLRAALSRGEAVTLEVVQENAPPDLAARALKRTGKRATRATSAKKRKTARSAAIKTTGTWHGKAARKAPAGRSRSTTARHK